MSTSRTGWSKRLRQAGVWQQVVLGFLALLTLYPFAFMLFTSLKTNQQFFSRFWLPSFPLHFENYTRVAPRVLLFIGNSLLYSVPTLLLVLALSLLAGYAFGRFRFRGREALFILMLSLLMLPGVLSLIPLFIQMRDFGWLDTPQGIVLPWVAFELVFATFIMRVFFEKLPKEIFEAARIDGAGQLRVLWGVALPLALPGLGTIAILDVLFSWNDIIWPLVSLFDRDSYPVAIGVLGFQGQYQTEYGPLFAAYTLSCLPLVVFFIFTVRRFIEGFEGGLSL
jgi:ABC-type glycerol-3-phosphate transport system permease component